MFCANCGKKNPEQANFCFACGSPLIPPKPPEGHATSDAVTVGHRAAEPPTEPVVPGTSVVSPAQCHLCGRPWHEAGAYYEFGLAKDKKRNWGNFAAMVAAGTVLAVFTGVGLRGMPGSTAKIVRCRLALCGRCVEDRRTLFGRLKVSKSDCARHPYWDQLHREGFQLFMDAEEVQRYR